LIRTFNGKTIVNAPWQRAVERIVMMALESKIRVLGLASPQSASGVSMLARSIAEVSAHSGIATLLLDLSRRAGDSVTGGWVPRPGRGPQLAVRDLAGFEILFGDPAPGARFLFNNVAQLRLAMEQELAPYGLIVVDLAPIGIIPDDAINPLAAALACDGVVVVGTMGHVTRTALVQAMHLMRSSGVKLLGTVTRDASRTRSRGPLRAPPGKTADAKH